ncbi:MAG: GGDEF domain-containing protein [Deltaproteobacteria bacterium]|nr:GGDEF domain-containing protein [Deltaproteobacteria bacterium]
MTSITKHLSKIPEHIKAPDYRFFVVTNYCYFLGFLLHFSFLFIFYFFNVMPMATYNLVSCTAFIISFITNKKGFHIFAIFLCCVEVNIHAILSIYFIGWNSGFHYYLLVIIPVVFLMPRTHYLLKSGMAAFFTICYICLHQYSLSIEMPNILLSDIKLYTLNYYNIIGTAILLAIIGYFYSTAAKNAEKALARLAKIDGLTQIANRRHYDSYIQKEWNRLKREENFLSILFIDIDFFKNYNDFYGHQAGDDCLKHVASTLKEIVNRPADLVARYGGEEFIISLPNTRDEGAKKVAHQIQEQLKKLQIPHARSIVNQYITCSMGIVSFVPNDNSSIEAMVEHADKALYQAKENGRNCIITADLS